MNDTHLNTIANVGGGWVATTLFAQMMHQPLSWQDFASQAVFGLITALGAAIATTTDFPPARPAGLAADKPDVPMRYRLGDVLIRIVVGGIIGMIFAAGLIEKLGAGELKSTQLVICGVLGILSWYLLRGLVAVGQWIRDAGILKRIAQGYVDRRVPPTPEPSATPSAPTPGGGKQE